MANLEFITNPAPIATLAARRKAILNAGTEEFGDLSREQESEVSALGSAIAAGDTLGIDDVAAQIEIASERVDLINDKCVSPEEAAEMWNEIASVIDHVHGFFSARAKQDGLGTSA